MRQNIYWRFVLMIHNVSTLLLRYNARSTLFVDYEVIQILISNFEIIFRTEFSPTILTMRIIIREVDKKKIRPIFLNLFQKYSKRKLYWNKLLWKYWVFVRYNVNKIRFEIIRSWPNLKPIMFINYNFDLETVLHNRFLYLFFFSSLTNLSLIFTLAYSYFWKIFSFSIIIK